MSILIPIPKDICSLIIGLLPSGLDQSTINLITNVCNNLSNEYITVNEVYNFVLGALPGLNEFISDLAIETTLKQTFTGYSEIWVPFQYGLLMGLILVVVTVLILTGYLDFVVGVFIMLGLILFLAVLGVIEFDLLVDFVNKQESDFKARFTAAFNSLSRNTLLNASLGFLAASQLTVNGPTGPNDIPLNGPIILTDSTATFHLYPPYFKVTVFQTQSTGPSVNPQPEVFNVQLQELDQTVRQAGVDIRFNTIKFQYGKIIYIINGNPSFKYPLLGGPGATGDSGIIKLVNVTSVYPPIGDISVGTNIDQVPLSSLDPPFEGPLEPYSNPAQVGNGVLIYPGEAKCFINTGYNQPLPPDTSTGLGFPNMAFSTWVELTADLRPFSSVFNSSSMNINLRPANRIIFLQVPTNANVNLTTSVSTTVAVKDQELYLISNPSSGSINIILDSGTTVLPKSNLMFLIFDGQRWIKGYP